MKAPETFLDGRVTLHCGDCLDVLASLPENSVDSVVCDPPYHLTSIVKRFGAEDAAPAQEGKTGAYARASRGFMGKQWDGGDVAFRKETWAAVFRVLKPGGHLLAFSGTRTYHRMACAIEDAGFEIRDMPAWMYGTGFPKSHSVSKGIDKARGKEGGKIATGSAVKRMIPGADQNKAGWEKNNGREYQPGEYVPADDTSNEWKGWGTALKPAVEPICMARKPLMTLAVDVRANVEAELRSRGVDGEITWTKRRAKDVGKLDPSISSSEIPALQTAETFADLAEESETVNADAKIRRASNKRGIAGTPQTQDGKTSYGDNMIVASENKSSMPMVESAPAAAKMSQPSSPSIISTAAGALIEDQSTGRSTPNSGEKDSLPDTEYFAGIATGLIGSMATVRISREKDGSFVWPHDLPEYVAAKPLTVAENVLKFGTGAINVDGCRIEHSEECKPMAAQKDGDLVFGQAGRRSETTDLKPNGRWPANVIHDGSEEVVAAFPDSDGQNGYVGPEQGERPSRGIYGDFGARPPSPPRGDTGSAARFFYSAKADAHDRAGSGHPTVKPVDLMQYLVRLVTPKGGTVLDPFSGTGTTGEAAFYEGFNAILIEREAEYQEDIRRRMKLALAGPEERARESIKAKLKDKPQDAGPLFGGVENAPPMAEESTASSLTKSTSEIDA